MAKGFFIVFEGIDGSGKTYATAHAAKFLFSKTHRDVVLTREPSFGKVGLKIRKMLANDHDPAAGAEKYLKLYVEDRKDHLKTTIAPALKAGKIVVCDRYFMSTKAFQQVQGITLGKIEKLHREMPVPDLTVLLDATPEIALERTEKRGNGNEKFEKLGFLKKVRQNYLGLARKAGAKAVVIDADQSLQKMLQQVEKTLGHFTASKNK